MLTMDIENRDVFWNGTKVETTMCEWRVIHLLATNPGHASDYRTIYDAMKDCTGFVAGYGVNGYHTNVRSCIKRIRRKFVAIDPTFTAIINQTGKGYLWDPAKAPTPEHCPTCGRAILILIRPSRMRDITAPGAPIVPATVTMMVTKEKTIGSEN